MTDSTGRVKVSDSFNDTWFEYGVGAAFASGKNSHVYFDVERRTQEVILQKTGNGI